MTSLLTSMPRIRPATVEDLPGLNAVMNGDGHEMIAPTHVIEKNGEVVGVLSLGGAPTVLLWMDSKKTNVRDSAMVFNFFENALGGCKEFFVPCFGDTPFLRYMTPLGFLNAGAATMFLRRKK